MEKKHHSPEFSRVYDFNTIKKVKKKDVSLEATTNECLALAERIQVNVIKDLSVNAVISVTHEPKTLHAVGILKAHVQQHTSDSFQEMVCPIDVFFKPEDEISEDTPIDADMRDIEPYTAEGMIDLGEVCAQYLSLALMPFPTAEDGAEILRVVYTEPRDNPLAILKNLQ